MLPYGRQTIDEADVEAVISVLRGHWITQGPMVERFEESLRERTGAMHAVAFSSGTAALHGAVAAAGLGPGDTLVTTPLTFAASANCARYVGARVQFSDIDPLTLNIDLERLPPCDAVVAVHYAGLPVDLSQMRSRPRIVIEDACHALGAQTPDGPVGNCARSEMCVFSFHPVKAIATGEGGAVTTNDPRLAEALGRFRNHGMVRHPEIAPWYYEIEGTGFNYRLTDIQAALGVSQMGKLEAFITRRNEVAQIYEELLAALPVDLPPRAPSGWRHGYHLYPVRVDHRRQVFEALLHAGVTAQVHYIPLNWHPAFRSAAENSGPLPRAEAAYEQLVSLPMFPTLRRSDQEHVVSVIEGVLTELVDQ